MNFIQEILYVRERLNKLGDREKIETDVYALPVEMSKVYTFLGRLPYRNLPTDNMGCSAIEVDLNADQVRSLNEEPIRGAIRLGRSVAA